MATTPAPGRTIISAMVDETQRDELIRLARAERYRSLSAQVRRAVTEHLERTAPDPNEPSR